MFCGGASREAPLRFFSRTLIVHPSDLIKPPAQRQVAIERLAAELKAGQRVVLSTHMNADGDACGSVAGLSRLLRQMGIESRIVNPTPWPATFSFLLGDDLVDHTAKGTAALTPLDALIVLDVSDVKRLGGLADAVRKLDVPRLVIDHHITTDEPAGDIMVSDTTACATGELVFDFAAWTGRNRRCRAGVRRNGEQCDRRSSSDRDSESPRKDQSSSWKLEGRHRHAFSSLLTVSSRKGTIAVSELTTTIRFPAYAASEVEAGVGIC
jgi:hypothetical protein